MPTRSVLVVASDTQHDWSLLKRSLRKCPEIVLIRASSSISTVLEDYHELEPSVLLVDYKDFTTLPRPAEFIRRAIARSIPVAVRVDQEAPEILQMLLRLGCKGVLGVNMPPEELCRAIQAIASGGLWAHTTLVSQVFEDLLIAENPFRLTRRETEILELVARGETNQRIAETLYISRETVRWHLRALYAKIGVHDRKAAALHAPGLIVGPRKPNQSHTPANVRGRFHQRSTHRGIGTDA